MAVGASAGRTLVVGHPGGVPAGREPLAAPTPPALQPYPGWIPRIRARIGPAPLEMALADPSLF